MKKKATTFSNHNLSHQGFYSFPHPVKQNQQQKLAHQGIAAKNNALNSHKIPHKRQRRLPRTGYQSSSLEFLGGALVASFNHITKPFRKKDLRI